MSIASQEMANKTLKITTNIISMTKIISLFIKPKQIMKKLK